MRELAAELERRLDVPIRDETQLTDKFDFAVKFSPEGMNGPGGQLVPAATAVDVQVDILLGAAIRHRTQT